MNSPNSVLVPSETALVVIDVQERLAAVMQHRDRVIARACLLVRAASVLQIPVVATRQYPKGLGDHSAAIGEALARAAADGSTVAEVDKVTFDCFAEPEFVAALERAGRRQIVVVGMESHICVCQTTLSGLRSGLDVHVAVDGCCSRDDANHVAAISRMAHAGAVMSTVESAAYELIGRAGTPEFKALLAAVKEYDASCG